jgi:hypothetical protein
MESDKDEETLENVNWFEDMITFLLMIYITR